MTVISDEHVEQVCKIGQGPACCRYLMMGAEGFQCEKGTSVGREVDARVVAGTYRSIGDNCPGWDVHEVG